MYSADLSLLPKAELVTLSERPYYYDSCTFKVEYNAGDLGKGNVAKFLQTTLGDDEVQVIFRDNNLVEVVSPASTAGQYDASASDFTLILTSAVSIARNGDFVVITDDPCDIRVGYDSDGEYTTVAIVVDPSEAEGLTGQCGKCSLGKP